MRDLPDNPTRYKASVAAWAIITAVFAVLLLYRVFVEPNDGTLIGIFGIGSFIGIWRFILAARRRRT